MAKIYIKLEGGTVTDCYSDIEDIDVIVVDHDVINDYAEGTDETADEMRVNSEECHNEIINGTVKLVY